MADRVEIIRRSTAAWQEGPFADQQGGRMPIDKRVRMPSDEGVIRDEGSNSRSDIRNQNRHCHSAFPDRSANTDVSDSSDYSAEAEADRDADRDTDEAQGNWLVRNLWMLKGMIAAIALAAFGVAILVAFDGTMANVVWAMSVTLAALIVLVQLGIGVVQSTRSV